MTAQTWARKVVVTLACRKVTHRVDEDAPRRLPAERLAQRQGMAVVAPRRDAVTARGRIPRGLGPLDRRRGAHVAPTPCACGERLDAGNDQLEQDRGRCAPPPTFTSAATTAHNEPSHRQRFGVAMPADAFADGRLTDDEFDQRARAALHARTTAELERLFIDLPATVSTTPTTPVPAARTKRPVHLTVGVLGDTWRRWRWQIAPRSAAVALLGGCRLDLRAATLTAPVTTITAVGVAGGIDVVVPPGVRVELNAYGLLCDAANRVPEQDLPADAPLVRVRLFGVLSAIETKPKFRFKTRPGKSDH